MNRLTALLFLLTVAALLTSSQATIVQITSWTGQRPNGDFENPNLWTNGVPEEYQIPHLPTWSVVGNDAWQGDKSKRKIQYPS